MVAKAPRDRSYLVTQMLSVWLLQGAIFVFIAQETYQKVELAFPDAIPSVAVTFTRFTAGMLMHLALTHRSKAGLDKMKFALNHSWRFDSVALAWLCGLSQVLITISIEILLYVLVVLSHDLLEVITTAVALAVVAKLHEVFSVELSSTELTCRVVKENKFAPLLTIKTTTSLLGSYGKPN